MWNAGNATTYIDSVSLISPFLWLPPFDLSFNPIWNPFNDRAEISLLTIGSSPIAINSKFCSTWHSTVLIFSNPNFLPMQSRFPALNGTYANGFRSPEANRSGSKTDGFGKCLAFIIIRPKCILRSTPAGMMRPSSETIHFKWINFFFQAFRFGIQGKLVKIQLRNKIALTQMQILVNMSSNQYYWRIQTHRFLHDHIHVFQVEQQIVRDWAGRHTSDNFIDLSPQFGLDVSVSWQQKHSRWNDIRCRILALSNQISFNYLSSTNGFKFYGFN